MGGKEQVMPFEGMGAEERIRGGTPMGERIRGYAWEETPLGPITGWPGILVANVNMMLSTELPMQLMWGAEMILIQNDTMVQTLGGRSIEATGQAARVYWSAAWPIVGEQLEGVLRTGQAVRQTRVLVPIERDGQMRDVYWSYSYSAIYGGNGEVGGILNLAQDVTEAVRQERETRETRDRLELAMDAAGQATWSFDLKDRRLRGDTRLRRMLHLREEGVSLDEFWSEHVHAEDRVRVLREFAAAMRGQRDYDAEYRVRRDGEVMWLRVKARLSH